MTTPTSIALVTGANRGIGLEVCRQLAQQGWNVILGARDPAKGESAAAALRPEGLNVTFQPLDVSDAASITAARAAVESQYGRLDALVNNAAIYYDTWQRAANADFAQVRQAFETNT
ncbi:MAG: SDR family NAD(P)-dependent oxidoreductase, partial [Anaerolineae bacterium]|nr:SDR family NAD(P)-dependent oxidoreductase [Anaerolineae bacterium]